MSVAAADIAKAISTNLPRAQDFLSSLVSIPSLPGCEQDAMKCAADAFASVATVEHIALGNTLRQDVDYCDPVPNIDYTGRENLRMVFDGAGGGQNLLLNAHIDTVPPSQEQTWPFEPEIRNGALYGRGSCDAKGQVATVLLAMAALKDAGIRLRGDLIGHIVVEEEVGGNGTLAMIRRGEKAAGCVVLEPTDLKILSSIRGAVWFRIRLTGKSGHSGQAGQTRSALKMAIRVVEILEAYHRQLLDESKNVPMFSKFANPMPLTIGQLHAGNWAAAAPGEAVLEGVLGLLPNKTAKQVMHEMSECIRQQGGVEITGNCDIHFTYRHDSSVCQPDHPLVAELKSAASNAGCRVEVDAMTASCDAWFYNNQLKIPTVVFGGGSLSVAHSKNEHMPLWQLSAAAEALARLAIKWCGTEKA